LFPLFKLISYQKKKKFYVAFQVVKGQVKFFNI